ncbi:unnamed protein product [Cercopithifilaria johnstoni]|uniref:Uncharacterized protein n=1 Tax=Cercopithifilaria johnstoni TaxID=2874296 RepID=A0A8J2M5N9_9BILA|nr:unnamed protein product [Cercopithifilaria johnstoni]
MKLVGSNFFADKQTHVIKNDFTLPEPDQQLDVVPPNRNTDKLQSSKAGNSSTMEVEVIIQQPPSNSRADDNNDDDSDDDCFNVTLMNYKTQNCLLSNNENLSSLNRNLSPRSFTFKRSDSTAPPESPLYKPPTTARRMLKPVVPPCSPHSLDV